MSEKEYIAYLEGEIRGIIKWLDGEVENAKPEQLNVTFNKFAPLKLSDDIEKRLKAHSLTAMEVKG